MIDHGNGTVTDPRTGLMWEQHPSETRYTWKDAIEVRIVEINAATSPLGEYTDWRLPSVQELMSLVDYTRHNPAINSVFTTVANGYYWSATPYATDYKIPDPVSYTAWLVYFYNGLVDDFNKDFFTYVRAVRAGS